jgi:hypothetical protein
MWASLIAFRDGLNHLRHYVEGIERQNELLSIRIQSPPANECETRVDQLQQHFQKSNNKKVFEYNSVIVSLYGYVERFIEELVSEYLKYLNDTVPSFEKLPQKVQEAHMELSLELIRNAHLQKNQGVVEKEAIISNLHACFKDPEKYKLNIDAYTQHSANFKQRIVDDLFARCGISGVSKLLRGVEVFLRLLESVDPERDLKQYLSKTDSIVFGELDDLAERRNEVAHGRAPSELLSLELLRARISFLEAYGEALARVVYERTLVYEAKYSAQLIGAPIAVYNSEIVCVDLVSGDVRVGDTLIAKTQDTLRPFKAGEIISLQRDRVDCAEIAGGAGVQIGMKVLFGAKQNQEFYLSKRKAV